MKRVYQHSEELECLNAIDNHDFEILSNVTERGYWKLHPSDLIDVRFGRSIFDYYFQSFHYYFALSMNMNNLLNFHL